MEDIIKQVIESEYRARQIVEEAEERRKHFTDTVEDEIRKIKDGIFASVNNEIEEIRKNNQHQADIKVKEIM